MKGYLFVYLAAVIVLPLAIAAHAEAQAGSAAPGPASSQGGADSAIQTPIGGTGPPDHVSPDFPSAPSEGFPGTTGSADFPSSSNPHGFDTTMPESGVGTGTDSTVPARARRSRRRYEWSGHEQHPGHGQVRYPGGPVRWSPTSNVKSTLSLRQSNR